MSISPETSELLRRLKIPEEALLDRRLKEFPEAADLSVAEVGINGRTHYLAAGAAQAWCAMKAAAHNAGISIFIVSGFRSVHRQFDIVERKLLTGQSIEDILMVSAPPGFSEHHTGRAVDIGTPGTQQLDEQFEKSAAFDWLMREGIRFGFELSYPRDNPFGYCYEPWHWAYRNRSRA